MSLSPVLDVLDRLRARWGWPVVVANLVAQIGIVVTGGAVRLTGSGLGLLDVAASASRATSRRRSTRAMAINPLIEFGNRTLTGVLLVIAVAGGPARRDRPRRPAVVPVARAAPAAAGAGAGGARRDHRHLRPEPGVRRDPPADLDDARGAVDLAHAPVPRGRRARDSLVDRATAVLVRVLVGAAPRSSWRSASWSRARVRTRATRTSATGSPSTRGSWPRCTPRPCGRSSRCSSSSLVRLRRAGATGRLWRTALLLLGVTLAQGADRVRPAAHRACPSAWSTCTCSAPRCSPRGSRRSCWSTRTRAVPRRPTAQTPAVTAAV